MNKRTSTSRILATLGVAAAVVVTAGPASDAAMSASAKACTVVPASAVNAFLGVTDAKGSGTDVKTGSICSYESSKGAPYGSVNLTFSLDAGQLKSEAVLVNAILGPNKKLSVAGGVAYLSKDRRMMHIRKDKTLVQLAMIIPAKTEATATALATAVIGKIK